MLGIGCIMYRAYSLSPGGRRSAFRPGDRSCRSFCPSTASPAPRSPTPSCGRHRGAEARRATLFRHRRTDRMDHRTGHAGIFIATSTVAIGGPAISARSRTARRHLPHAMTTPARPGGIANVPAWSIVCLLSVLLVDRDANRPGRFNTGQVMSQARRRGASSSVAHPMFKRPIGIPASGADIDADGQSQLAWAGVLTGASRIFFAYIGFARFPPRRRKAMKPQRTASAFSSPRWDLHHSSIIYRRFRHPHRRVHTTRSTSRRPSPMHFKPRGSAGPTRSSRSEPCAGITTVMLGSTSAGPAW